MARKARVPPPPRPVQAPRTRLEERRRNWRPLLIVALGSGAVVAAAVAAFAFGLVGGRSGGPEAALRAAGCAAKVLPDQGASHLQDLKQPVKYNSFPPTSGPHFQQPAIFNAYDQPIEPKMGVHNLEHGGVLVQYGSKVAPQEVERLTDYWRDDPTGLVLAPLPKLGRSVALTAWTHLALCPSFDEAAFDAFVGAYRFKGPERLPPEALQPGS